MKKNHEVFYKENKKYTSFLETHPKSDYEKYTSFVKRYLRKNESFLDVGCGIGTALKQFNSKKYKVFGIEVSKSSVMECKKKGINCKSYNGETIPFKDGSFDIVGSFNVLEHTEKPFKFLNENARVVKPGGYLFIICPNFLSITNSYHANTKGIKQKVRNLYSLLKKTVGAKHSFKRMKTIVRDVYQADDDAVNETNPVDIRHWARKSGLKLVFWSSQQKDISAVNSFLDKGVLKHFLGSCFFIFQKQ